MKYKLNNLIINLVNKLYSNNKTKNSNNLLKILMYSYYLIFLDQQTRFIRQLSENNDSDSTI